MYEIDTVHAIRLEPDSVDSSNHTVEAVLATPNPTVSLDLKTKRPVRDLLDPNGANFNGGRMMLLADHAAKSNYKPTTFDVYGEVRNIRREGDNHVGALAFDDGDEDAMRLFSKVCKGFLRSVSIGYAVHRSRVLAAGSTVRIGSRDVHVGRHGLRLNQNWTGREVSLVPIGADELAKVRQQFGGFDDEPQASRLLGANWARIYGNR